MKDLLLSLPALMLYGTVLGVLAEYWFTNHYNKPGVKVILRMVLVEIEKKTAEGTPADTLLDAFLVKFAEVKGREPNAGEIKTAKDLGLLKRTMDLK